MFSLRRLLPGGWLWTAGLYRHSTPPSSKKKSSSSHWARDSNQQQQGTGRRGILWISIYLILYLVFIRWMLISYQQNTLKRFLGDFPSFSVKASENFKINKVREPGTASGESRNKLHLTVFVCLHICFPYFFFFFFSFFPVGPRLAGVTNQRYP